MQHYKRHNVHLCRAVFQFNHSLLKTKSISRASLECAGKGCVNWNLIAKLKSFSAAAKLSHLWSIIRVSIIRACAHLGSHPVACVISSSSSCSLMGSAIRTKSSGCGSPLKLACPIPAPPYCQMPVAVGNCTANCLHYIVSQCRLKVSRSTTEIPSALLQFSMVVMRNGNGALGVGF